MSQHGPLPPPPPLPTAAEPQLTRTLEHVDYKRERVARVISFTLWTSERREWKLPTQSTNSTDQAEKSFTWKKCATRGRNSKD